MPRTFRKKERLGALSEINVTPLIDLAFVLLIIFMIATPLIEHSIPIELPEKETESTTPNAVDFETISIDREGRYFWGKEAIKWEALENRLSAIAMQPNPPVLKIRADRSLPYQNVVSLLDLITSQQLTKINLETL